MILNDEELVQQTLAGDVGSFGQLVNRHRGAVQGLAYHWVGRFEDAEDIAQEAFVTAYLKLSQLRQPECFTAWLRQLTLNHCRKWIKKQKAMTPFEKIEATTASSDSSPAEVLEDHEVQRLVHTSLGRLSESHRLVIALRYLGAMSYEEIARFLDVPLATVRGRLHRAKKQLKGHLMQTIEDTLHGERLDDDFTRKVLEQARKRAKETQAQWHKEDFVLSVQKGLEAAEQLHDTKAQIEMLSLLGEAGATWLGEKENAITHYESALAIARQQEDRDEEARLLNALYLAHARHGEYKNMQGRAGEALAVWTDLQDPKEKAKAQAALDLADSLPGEWSPGQPGGYMIAVFPVEESEEGLTWDDPEAEINYSWGVPSRCAALANLLHPRHFLGSSLSVGAQWKGRIPHQRPIVSWYIKDGDPELLAHSVIERSDDVVVTPANEFTDCLRVQTHITPLGADRATEHMNRSFCGIRTAWYAPGVGLVKLRHEDQNDTVWWVYLTHHEGLDGTDYFPRKVGHVWHYQWRSGVPGESYHRFFRDICRVVHDEGGRTWLSSATWGIEQTPAERLDFYKQVLIWEERSGDEMGQAGALEEIAGLCEERQKTTCYERLLSLYETLGDQWRLLETRQSMHAQWDELAARPMLEKQLALARKLGDRRKTIGSLRNLAGNLRIHGSWEKAVNLLEEAAALDFEIGDTWGGVHSISAAEEAREIGKWPPVPKKRAYLTGQIRVLEKEDGRLYPGGSSAGHLHREPFPPVPLQTPMDRFSNHDPYIGISLLNDDIGSMKAGSQTGWETMKFISTLKGRDEKVSVAAGLFQRSVQLETAITTSAEDPHQDEHIERIRGFVAGTITSWFTLGIGLVRLFYQHENGYETDIQLQEYEIAKGEEEYFPLKLDNRWRYRWIDPESGTFFEEVLCLAAHENEKWYFATVTRAEVGK